MNNLRKIEGIILDEILRARIHKNNLSNQEEPVILTDEEEKEYTVNKVIEKYNNLNPSFKFTSSEKFINLFPELIVLLKEQINKSDSWVNYEAEINNEEML